MLSVQRRPPKTENVKHGEKQKKAFGSLFLKINKATKLSWSLKRVKEVGEAEKTPQLATTESKKLIKN